MNEYDVLLQKAANTNPYEELVLEAEQQERGRVTVTAKEAATVNPDQSAEIIDLSKRFNVPPAMVERNIDEFRKGKEQREVENFYDSVLKTPEMKRWLQDKHNVAASKDDLANLSLSAWVLEAPKRAYRIGEAQTEFGNLRYRSMFGNLTAEEHRRMDQLRREMSVDLSADAIPAQILTGTAQQLPILFESLKAGFKTGAPVAMMSGAVASAAGPASPVTVPVATGIGYVAGQTAGAAEFGFVQEAGHAYEEFSRFKDENGQPLDPATAKVAALAAGAINAGFDAAQITILLKSIPGFDKLTAIPGRLVVRKALQQQNVRMALTEFAKNYGGVLATESGIEVAQRAVTIMSGEMAKAASGQNIESREIEDVLKDLGQEGYQALLGFSLISAPGPMIRAGIDLKDAHNAKQRENFFLALGGNMESSKLRERMPEAAAKFVEAVTKDGPAEFVYVEPQVVERYFQEKNVDPRQAMKEVMGSSEPYEQALQGGHMLQIPTQQYATVLAPTEHNAFFAKELRFGPEELNQREVEEIVKEAEAQQQQEQAQQEEEAQRTTVADQVRAMLEAAGQDPKSAETMAEQMGAFFDTIGERTGSTGLQRFKEYALDIVRRVTGKPAPQESYDQITAYHGTPKNDPFDQFSMDFIGTGEGAQVHGWGLYFARMKSTADTRYRARLGGYRVDGATDADVNTLQDRNWLLGYRNAKTTAERKALLDEYIFRTKDAMQKAQAVLDNHKRFGNQDAAANASLKLSEMAQRMNLLEKMKVGDLKVVPAGRTYTVDLKVEDSDLLNLDEPVVKTKMLDKLKQAISIVDPTMDAEWVADPAQTGRHIYRFMVRRIEQTLKDPTSSGYEDDWGSIKAWLDQEGITIRAQPGSPTYAAEIASKILLSLGIKGLSYDGKIDGPSMVIFDESLIDIVSYEQRKTKTQEPIKFSLLREAFRKVREEAQLPAVIEPEQQQSGGPQMSRREFVETARGVMVMNSPLARLARALVSAFGKQAMNEVAKKATEPVAKAMIDSLRGVSKSEVLFDGPLFMDAPFAQFFEKLGVEEILSGSRSDYLQEDPELGQYLTDKGLISVEDSELWSKLANETFDYDKDDNSWGIADGVTKKDLINALLKRAGAKEDGITDMDEREMEDGSARWETMDRDGIRHVYNMSLKAEPWKALKPIPDDLFAKFAPLADRYSELYQLVNRRVMDINSQVTSEPDVRAWYDQIASLDYRDPYRRELIRLATEQVNERNAAGVAADSVISAARTEMQYLQEQASKLLTEAGFEAKVFENGYAPFLDAPGEALRRIKPDDFLRDYEYQPQSYVSAVELRVKGAAARAFVTIMDEAKRDGLKEVHFWSEDMPSQVNTILKNMGVELSEGSLPQTEGRDVVRRVSTDIATEGVSFEQSETKGRMLKFGEYEYSIELFENADLSTFLHESGHFYLEVMRSMAKDHPQIKEDLDTIVKWMGAESADKIERVHHEKFARGIETYFMEGKAPSVKLRAAFARFRAWLKAIYQKLTSLDAQLNDDVRAVMDRMFATDAEIEAAKRESQIQPVFVTAEQAGMRPEEFERYLKLVEAANVSAREELEVRLMKQYSREQSAWWEGQKDAVREEVMQEFLADNDVQAYSILRFGKMADGSPLPEGLGPIKLDRYQVVEAYGKASPKSLNVTERLRRLGMYRAEGGLPLSVAAEILGYSSGDHLVRAVLEKSDWREQAERRVDQVMKERYGDMLTDGTLHDMALKAVNNERRSELLHAELKALTRKRNEVQPFVQEERNRLRAEREQGLATVRGVPPLEMFQQLAKARIAAMQIRGIRPSTYLVAARRAAVEAVDAATKGDYQTAAVQKQQELFNMELYREARNATEAVDSSLDFVRSLNTPAARKRFGQAGDVYVQQIESLMERFDFAPITLRQIDKRVALADFIDRMEKAGEPVDIDPKLADEAFRKPYKAMTYEEFQGVVDAFRNINHLAKLKNKLLKAKHKRDLGEVLDQVESTIRNNATGRPRDLFAERLPQYEAGRLVNSFFAAHRKLASMARQLDGFVDNGPVWEHIMLPLNEASNHEASMIHEAGLKLAELFAPYTGAKQIAENVTTRLSLGTIAYGMYRAEYIPAIDTSLSKMQRLMVALNMGNKDNQQKLMEGYGWNADQVQAILEPLTKEDWDFVQGVWDFVNSYWPQIEAKQKRVTGVAPTKVEAVSVSTKFGEYKGGYFPLLYDDRISPQAYAHRAAEAAKMALRGAYAKGTTKRGHTIERVDGVKMPVRLDFGTIFEHIHNVIHDLAFHEALIDVNRVLGHRQTAAAIIDSYGDHVYKMMNDAVNDTAAGEIPAITAVEKSLNWLRHGVSIAAMGWNLMTGLMQPLGISQSIVRIGPEWVFKGISRWIGDTTRMENSVKWIHSKSEFMQNRYYTLNREINDIRNRLYGGGGTSAIKDSYFWLITRFQLVADVPTWLGAYERFMSETQGDEARAIALADQAVLDSQGGGQVKDLADVQRHGPLMRLWTNFYSYFNVTYNLTAEQINKAKMRNPASVVAMAWNLLLLYTVPAVLGFAIKEAMKGGEDYDEEELLKRMAGEQASYILGTMIGFREFGSVVQGFYGYEGPAGTRFFSETSQLIKQVGQGEADEAMWKALNNTGGILLHYPSGQVQRTVEGYAALQEGRGAAVNLISGKPRE